MFANWFCTETYRLFAISYHKSTGTDIIYGDIMTGENLSSNKVANMDLIYRSVRSSNMMGGDGVNLASCKY